MEKKYKCDYCNFSTNYLGNAWEHSLNLHPTLATDFTPQESDNIVLRIVAEQTASLSNEIEDLKSIFSTAFRT